MFKIFDNVKENVMDKISDMIVSATLSKKNEVNMTENTITIFCSYTGSSLDLLADGWNFMVELWCTFRGDKLLEGQCRTNMIKRIYYAFDNRDDAYLFARKIYDNYKNVFGEIGYNSYSLPNVGISFSSGSLDFDLQKGIGINFVCSGIDLNNFINIGEAQSLTKKNYTIK